MTLDDIVKEADALPSASIDEKLAWLERAAAAAEAADIGPPAQEGALSLRAALGVIVKWTQGVRDPDSLAELDLVVRTLLARALLAFVTALADHYELLASERAVGPARAACQQAALAYRDVARAVRNGERVPASAKEHLAQVQHALAVLG